MAIGKNKKFFAGGKWQMVKTKYFSPAENGDWQNQNIFRRRKTSIGKNKIFFTSGEWQLVKTKYFLPKAKVKLVKAKVKLAKSKCFLPKSKVRLAKAKVKLAISKPRSANKNGDQRAENVDPVLCLHPCRLC